MTGTREFAILGALLLAAALLCLPLLTAGYHRYDMLLLQNWGNLAREAGLPSLYEGRPPAGFDRRTTNHPPLHPYLLAFDSWLSEKVFGDSTPLRPHSVAVWKLVPCLAHLGIGVLIYLSLRSRSGIRPAFLAAASYLFNPALVYSTACWGQADSIGAFLMLLSVLSLVRGRPAAALSALTLAVLAQLRSLVVLPVVGCALAAGYRAGRIAAALLAALALVLAVCFPYLAARRGPDVVRVLVSYPRMYPYASCGAYNLWYLARPHATLQTALGDTTRWAGAELRTIGLILFLGYLAFVLWRYGRNRDPLLSAAALCFAFFMLPTQVHSRYLFPFLAFLALLLDRGRAYLLVYGLVSLGHLLNLMGQLPFRSDACFFYRGFQAFLDAVAARNGTLSLGVAVSLVNCLAFAVFTSLIARSGVGPTRSPGSCVRSPKSRRAGPDLGTTAA